MDFQKGRYKRIYDFDAPQDLEKLSLPARDLVDIKSYHRIVDGELATSLIFVFKLFNVFTASFLRPSAD